MSGMRFEENRITRFTLYTRSCDPCTYFCVAVDDHKDTQFSRRLLLVLYATARRSIQRLLIHQHALLNSVISAPACSNILGHRRYLLWLTFIL